MQSSDDSPSTSLSSDSVTEEDEDSSQGSNADTLQLHQATTSTASSSSIPRRRIPWTEDEHKLFLLGVEKYGRGYWKSISRTFVRTKSATQTASHAQKHFEPRVIKRSSIFDIKEVDNESIDDLVKKGLLSPIDASEFHASRLAKQHGAQAARGISFDRPVAGQSDAQQIHVSQTSSTRFDRPVAGQPGTSATEENVAQQAHQRTPAAQQHVAQQVNTGENAAQQAQNLPP